MGNTNKKEFKILYKAIIEDNSIKMHVLSKHATSQRVLDQHDKYGRTLLHIAARFSSPETVIRLIDKGLDVNVNDSWGLSPLGNAVLYDRLTIAKILIDRGADVNANVDACQSLLYKAIMHFRLDIVKCLTDRGVDICVRNNHGRSPIYEAMKCDARDILYHLLNTKANLCANNSPNKEPLHDAIRDGRLDMFKLLTDRGSDICVTSSYAKSLLHDSIVHNQLDIVKFLTDCGIDVHTNESSSLTPLHTAVIHGSFDMIKLLIDRGAQVNACDQEARSPLRYAVLKSNRALVRFQLTRDESDDVMASHFGDRSTRTADDMSDNSYVIYHVINIEADVNAVCSSVLCPLNTVARHYYQDIVKLLSDKDRGYLVSNREVISELKKFKGPTVSSPITKARGGDVVNKYLYRSHLHDAVTQSNLEVITLLIDSGAEVCACDTSGISPLKEVIYSVKQGTMDNCILWLFLEKCNVVRKFDGRALCVLIQLLVQHGCGINRQGEVNTVAKQLIDDCQYYGLLRLISAGLYPSSSTFNIYTVLQARKRYLGDIDRISQSDTLHLLMQRKVNLLMQRVSLLTQCVSKLTEVRSLQIMCRDIIRQTISHASNKAEIVTVIRRMVNIPQKLKGFLSCNELLC